MGYWLGKGRRMMDTWRCSKCGQVRDIAEFEGERGERRRWCAACRAANRMYRQHMAARKRGEDGVGRLAEQLRREGRAVEESALPPSTWKVQPGRKRPGDRRRWLELV